MKTTRRFIIALLLLTCFLILAADRVTTTSAIRYNPTVQMVDPATGCSLNWAGEWQVYSPAGLEFSDPDESKAVIFFLQECSGQGDWSHAQR